MKMKMTTLCAALSGALLLSAATIVPAQSNPNAAARTATPSSMENKSGGISNDEYKREKDRVEAEAKRAKEGCKDQKDNAKDVCMAQAKADEKVAKKELDYKKNPNDKNRNDLEKVRAEAAYEVAKEKCEDSQDKGQIADCKKQAKAEKDRKVAALQGDRKNVARTDQGMAARSGSTAGNTGGAATGLPRGENTSNTMAPGGMMPSDKSNVRTQGTSTAKAGSADSASATGADSSGTASSRQGKSGQ